jgi:hypothetical protein
MAEMIFAFEVDVSGGSPLLLGVLIPLTLLKLDPMSESMFALRPIHPLIQPLCLGGTGNPNPNSHRMILCLNRWLP